MYILYDVCIPWTLDTLLIRVNVKYLNGWKSQKPQSHTWRLSVFCYYRHMGPKKWIVLDWLCVPPIYLFMYGNIQQFHDYFIKLGIFWSNWKRGFPEPLSATFKWTSTKVYYRCYTILYDGGMCDFKLLKATTVWRLTHLECQVQLSRLSGWANYVAVQSNFFGGWQANLV